MITTIGGHHDFTADTQFVAVNLQVPADENWTFLSLNAACIPLELMRVQIFVNTILDYDFIFVNYTLPYHVNRIFRGGTVVRMLVSIQAAQPVDLGAFMNVNRVKV